MIVTDCPGFKNVCALTGGATVAPDSSGNYTLTGAAGQTYTVRVVNSSVASSRPGSVGTLIGRVGNSAPFVIGATTSAIPMPVDGRLYLGVNDDDYRDNTGTFDVQIYRR